MKVILLRDVKGVGKKFEERDVSDGYASNFLIPKKLAVSLSDSSANAIKTLKEQGERVQANEQETLSKNLAAISGMKFEMKMKANENGHLFEKITAFKISETLNKEKGILINPEHIQLENPIKEVGVFEIPVDKTHFTLVVERA